jgi:hypothetical protein
MTGLEHALTGLRQALDAPRRHTVWRWLVRQRMEAVRDALAGELSRDDDAALAAREQTLQRDRTVLLGRLAVLGPRVLDEADADVVREDLLRLVAAVDRYRQRLNDLVSSAEGAGFEPAADISASDRFQGGSDRPLRHPSTCSGPTGSLHGASVYEWRAGAAGRDASAVTGRW